MDLPPIEPSRGRASPRPRRAALPLALMFIAWSLCISAGALGITHFAITPGAQGTAPETWPTSSAVPRDPARSTLLIFVHPQCPCSRASLAELNEIMNEDRNHASAVIVFWAPPGAAPGWQDTEDWRRAGELPHTTRVVDIDGEEAGRFGALTSGQVVLYGADGRLQFAGGITNSRGHEGDNIGRRTVLALLDGERTPLSNHAVFGCALNVGASAGSSGGGL